MGSGKSSIGRMLAVKLAWEFSDLDDIITERTGKSIPDLFAQHGEDTFRLVEASAIYSTTHQEKVVIATGGGAPCFHDSMNIMNSSGLTIYLECTVSCLTDRILQDQTRRPLIEGKNKEELLDFIGHHLQSRKNIYEQSKIKVDGTGGVEDIVDEILNTIDRE